MKTGEEERQLAESKKRILVHPNWAEAARASRHEKAISKNPITVSLPRGRYRVKIVKPLRGDPYAVYATAEGIRVHDWKPNNRHVDEIREWRVM